MSESRLVSLELRFMKLERFVQELSDVVAERGQAIETLTAEVKRLRGQVSAQDPEHPNDRPPHY
jgi:uncharacterized coiled-coil protein SlyX